jgi:hypothetical protein
MSGWLPPEVCPGEVVMFKLHPRDTQWQPFQVHQIGDDGITGLPVGKSMRYDGDVFNLIHCADPRIADSGFVRNFFDEDSEKERKGVWDIHPLRRRREANEARWQRTVDDLSDRVAELEGKGEKPKRGRKADPEPVETA